MSYCDNCPNSAFSGELIDGMSFCRECLELCWDCELDIDPDEALSHGAKENNFCQACWKVISTEKGLI